MEDNVEHIARCSVIRTLFARHLGVAMLDGNSALDMLFGFMKTTVPYSTIAVGIYATYMVHNRCRRGELDGEDVGDAFSWFWRRGRSSD